MTEQALYYYYFTLSKLALKMLSVCANKTKGVKRFSACVNKAQIKVLALHSTISSLHPEPNI